MMTDTCTSSISAFLTTPYTGWISVVVIAALMIISGLALVYAISPIVGRSDIRTWVRLKIFDVILALIFIVIFAGFATATCTYNPVSTFKNAGLVPNFCLSAQTINGVATPAPNNIYSLALCDIFSFNTNTYYIINWAVFGGLAVLAAWPQFKLDVDIGNLAGIQAAIALPIPLSGGLGTFLGTLYLLQIFNQVQLILLAAAPLLFALFMSIGLMARVFGITRTFGGAMIALGVGIGFVYPLLVGITYGFVGQAVGSLWTNILTSIPNILKSEGLSFVYAIGWAFTPGTTVGSSFNLLSNILSQNATTVSTNAFYQLLEIFGLDIAGAVFLPILNFIILDAFIVDFSKAIGEQISFMRIIEQLL